MKRRKFMRDLAVSAGALAALGDVNPVAAASGTAVPAVAEKSTVRDRFWMYTCWEGFKGFPAIPGESRMTPAEAGAYFNVPNVYIAAFTYPEGPSKLLPPIDYEPYLISFRPFKRVVWFLSEQGGAVTDATLRTIRGLAKKYPNIVGFVGDDYFVPTVKGHPGSPFAIEEIDYVRSQLNIDGRNLDFWIVYYRHNLAQDVDHVVPAYLNRIDVITYWSAYAHELETMEEDFARLEQVTPGKRKLLGCYMWDFQANRPLPLPLAQKQCRVGLEWLRKGRIEGMMFLGNFLCDRGLEAVEWTRNWVQEVGDEPL